MSLRILKTLCLPVAALIVAIAAASAPAQFLYPNYMLPKVATPWADTPYDSVLMKTWQGIKATLVDAYPTGLVHRPKSNRPDDAVSEGVSYGMFLALYMNDQTYFNKIWEAGVSKMWVGGEGNNYYDWRVDPQGDRYHGIGDRGPASDADQDIALLLIFADQLVKRNVWKSYTGSVSGGYAAHARLILNSIRTTMIASNGALLPGRWGEMEGFINPGYFAPAFYRIFAEFDSDNAAAWNSLVNACYTMIAKSPGYARGLLPDWFNFNGGTTGGAGYNAYHDGDALYRDAIRIYWRLATDYLWYKEPRAKTFLDNAMNFLETASPGKDGKNGPAAANFYTMSGNLLPENDVEVLEMGGRNIVRGRREHSHLTLGMWAAAAMGSGGRELAKKYSDALLGFYQPGTTYWGHPVDATGGRLIANAVDVDGNEYPNITVKEDTLHNEMYFDQFLAWFGASILAGNFTNVWEDLKDGVPQGPPTWVNKPADILTNWNINAGTAPFTFSASVSRAVRWSVELKHDVSGASRTFSGNSASIAVTWYGTNEIGGYMPQGWYTLTLSADGLTYRAQVWLGRPYSSAPNLLSGNRLLVDDFADGNIYPYIGREWGVHTRSAEGSNKPANLKSEIPVPLTDERLTWNYSLDGASWRVAALDWNTDGAMNFSGGVVDTIIFTAAVKTAGLEVSVQLLSAHFAANEDKFFEHVITLNSTSQTEYKIPLNAEKWTQREYGEGGVKSFETTISQITGIRWHVQYDAGHTDESKYKSGSITMNNMYFAGRSLSSIYTYEQPPAYISPNRDPEVVGIAVRRAHAPTGFAIRKIGGAIRLTLPQNMVGANVSMIDVRGRTVKRMTAPPSGIVNITARDLASGMYFVEVKKRGVKTVRVPFNNVR